ncbi:MAG TPA: BlaI/MecI/CopY family transcriptional regulator [Micromonosporaceae bacterium]|nr:BlaI/MecI/CopY family transcriptional regulator [Micromonosporaceae bacterium]
MTDRDRHDRGRHRDSTGVPARPERRAAGALESAVLEVLRAADRPLTPTEIQSKVGPDLAYNTVHTILTRLQDKGDVMRVRRGARTGYVPVKDAAQDAADRMRDALAASREHGEVLQRFVTALSREEEAALRAALDASRET